VSVRPIYRPLWQLATGFTTCRTGSFCNAVDGEWDDTEEFDLEAIDRMIAGKFIAFALTLTVSENTAQNSEREGEPHSYVSKPVEHQLQCIPQASTGQATEQAMGSRMAWDCLRYDTRRYFNVRSKAGMSQLNIPYGTSN